MHSSLKSFLTRFRADRQLSVTGNKFATKTILCIGRNLFDKDIRQLSINLRGYRWMTLHNSFFGELFGRHIPRDQQQQRVHRDFPGADNAWGAATRDAEDILRHFIDKHNVVAILDANIDYWQSYALQRACNNINLPFFVVSKENTGTPVMEDWYRELYADYRFIGTELGCPSPMLKNVYLETGTVLEGQASITGNPRFDIYINPHFNRVARNNVLFITFHDGASYSLGDENGYWNLVRSVVSVEGQHTSIKCKKRTDRAIHRKMVKDFGRSAQTTITRSGELLDLIAQSQVAVGLNSHAVLEPIMAGLPVVLPDYLADRKPGTRFFENRSDTELQELGIYRANGPQEVLEMIEDAKRRYASAAPDPDKQAARDDLVNTVQFFSRTKSSSALVGEMFDRHM